MRLIEIRRRDSDFLREEIDLADDTKNDTMYDNCTGRDKAYTYIDGGVAGNLSSSLEIQGTYTPELAPLGIR